jgi:hypothetical protein
VQPGLESKTLVLKTEHNQEILLDIKFILIPKDERWLVHKEIRFFITFFKG